MVYTCYDMIRNCREGRPEGWIYFISNYVPVIRRLLSHYVPNRTDLAGRVAAAIGRRESTLFQSLEPSPERWFVAELRQKVLAEIVPPVSVITLDLESAAGAFEPLTVTEKQAVWLEAMLYPPDRAGAMLRMAPATVEKIRGKAADLLRSGMDTWRAGMLAENGISLGRAAAAAATPQCPPSKLFLDILDGRITWHDRENAEQHVSHCWHCIDHACRMTEVVELLRGLQPLTEEEAAPFRELLGVRAPKKPLLKRLFAR